MAELSDADIEALIEEDLGLGDLTTRSLGIGSFRGRMTFQGRQDMIVSGTEVASRILARLGLRVETVLPSGSAAGKGALLLEAHGTAEALHAAWKVVQTLMEWSSGIATATHSIVAAARVVSPGIVIHCTRKAAPLTRRLSQSAVLAGGGQIHRQGLFDSVMLFPEHRVFLDRGAGIGAAIAALRRHLPERSVMVEVVSEDEAIAAASADVIQLEKFTPEQVARIVKAIPKRADGRPVVAAAGGISRANAADYARAGADSLITSAPYHAPPQDIKVTLFCAN